MKLNVLLLIAVMPIANMLDFSENDTDNSFQIKTTGIKEICRTRSYQACKVEDKPGHACMPEPGTCKKLMECTPLPTLPITATHEQIVSIATGYVNNLVLEDYICLSEFNESVDATVDRIYYFYSTGN